MKGTQAVRDGAGAESRRMRAWFVALTFFRSGARGLHVPARLTAEPTKHEARKRRANERPRVACCEELGCVNSRTKCNASRKKKRRSGTLTNLLAGRNRHAALSPDHL